MGIIKYFGLDEMKVKKYNIQLTENQAYNIYSSLVNGIPPHYLNRRGFEDTRQLLKNLEKIANIKSSNKLEKLIK